MFFAENGFDELGSLSYEQFLGIQYIHADYQSDENVEDAAYGGNDSG